jgi:hypothetical protein
MRDRRAFRTFLVLAVLCLLPQTAAAQGKGRPKGPKVTQSTTPPAPGTPAPVASFRQFGLWLDDASAPTHGEGRTGIGIGYYRLDGASHMNMPSLDFGYGLTNRWQVSASLPFYRSSFDGTTSRGLDDTYFSAKWTMIDPAESDAQFGLAVSPVLEVLSAGAPDGRVHFAFPVSVELRRQPYRVYGSTGYFTRGSIFSAVAIERGLQSGLVLTGALTHSYSTNDDAMLDATGIGRKRMDLTAAAAYPVFGSAAAYVSVGRTLTRIDEGGTTVALSGGLSFRFSTPVATQ